MGSGVVPMVGLDVDVGKEENTPLFRLFRFDLFDISN